MTSTTTVRPTQRLSVLAALATVVGFVVAISLTIPVEDEIRILVGEWGAVVVFIAGAAPLAVVDAREHRLPNRGTIPLATTLLGYWTGVVVTTGQWQLLVQTLVAAAAIVAIAGVIAMVGTLGGGDVKLFLAIGLLTGWVSWMLPLYALLVGYLLAIPQASMILLRGRRRGTRFPFGPYLIAGTVTVAALALIYG